MKAVIDTNVFLAALINQNGAPAKMRTHWLKNQFTLVASSQIEREDIDVLYHSPLLKLNTVDGLLREIAIHSEFIPNKHKLTHGGREK